MELLNTQCKHILETQITNVYETKQTLMGIMLVIQGEYGKFIQASHTSTYIHTQTFFFFYGVEGLT